MKKPLSFHRISRPITQSGVALVLTLSILVIATVIVTAFFFRSRYDVQGSGSYSSQISAKKLAELGASQVTASFMAEMVAGSSTVLGAGTADQKLIVSSADAKFMVPDRKFRINPTAAPDPNDPYLSVVRQSAPNFSNATVGSVNISSGVIVSDVNTSTAGPNRAGLDGKFWGKPMLTTDTADLFTAAKVPNWIYVSANGTTPKTKTTDQADEPTFVVGRYAFTAYDVGGLLDANSAGFTDSSKSPRLAGRKGSLIFADLGQLATKLGVALDATKIEDLNKWRYANMTTGDWEADSKGVPSAKLDVLLRSGAMLASIGKFNPGIDTAIGRLNQNAFLSRGDMIRYFASVLDSGDPKMPNTKKILPYLTHFVRDVNQPTFVWGWDNDGRAKITNARANSVGSASGAMKAINDDPWDTAGKMRISRRFPLDRLDLLKIVNGAPNGDPALIKRYFGLVWNPGGGNSQPHWDYKPVNGGEDQIRKLGDVNTSDLGTPGMEPNFFEMLSAAINCGSLGQQYGGVAPLVTGKANRPHAVYVPSTTAKHQQWDASVDSHVMRIGAAIIDQWDSDSYPTEIKYDNRTIFGVEDLPYLHGFKRMSYFMNSTPSTLTFNSSWTNAGGASSLQVVEGGTFMHPQLWNPHSSLSGIPSEGPTKFRVIPYVDTLEGAGSNNPTTTTPVIGLGTDFGRAPRVVSFGDINGSLRYDLYVSGSNPPLPGSLNWDSKLPNLAKTDYLEFSASANTFREPILLWKKDNTGTTGSVNVTTGGNAAQEFSAKFLTYTDRTPTPSNKYVGFRIGQYLTQNTLFPGTSGNIGFNQIDWVQYKAHLNSTVRVNFALEYQSAAGDWRIYDIMYDTIDFPRTDEDSGKKAWRAMGIEFDATYRADPRVERFGPQSQYYRTLGASLTSMPTFPPNSTGLNGSTFFKFFDGGGGDNGQNSYNATTAGAGLTTLWKNLTAAGTTWSYLSTNNSASTGQAKYLDPDMQYRPAAGAAVPSPADNPASQSNSSARPIVLNRKFQSIAEMGYACRDIPWKSVDFWNSNSGDTALLDYFCMHETDADPTGNQVTAGVVNLNSANPLVLASLISGGSVLGDGSDRIDFDKAEKISDELFTWLHADSPAGPLRSRGDIVGAWRNNAYYGPFTGTFASSTGAASPVENSTAIKDAINDIGSTKAASFDNRRTNLMRALIDSSTVRTWNLMIDVVAQSGKVKRGGDLQDFVVDGQARNWVFVSIDRLTGKIIDLKTESAD